MRTKNRSFQLEKTIPGIFLLQGALGGILTGLVYLAAMCYWNNGKLVEALFVFSYFAIVGTIFGVIKSTIMWGTYRLTKFQPRAAVRVVIASISTALFAYILGLKFGTGRTNDMIAWVVTMFAGGLPIAILVGSSVKPWELFTFGSIAIGDSRTGGRVGSKSLLATLATLPLRFLSLTGLALWILYCACEYDPTQGVIGPAIIFSVPVIYLLFSSYVTFKSPHRVLLLVSCIALNIPVGVVTSLAYKINPGSYLFNDAFPYVCGIGSAFLLAWALFLVARLNVPTQSVIGVSSHLDHHCLGSRFMEWQEHHA